MHTSVKAVVILALLATVAGTYAAPPPSPRIHVDAATPVKAELLNGVYFVSNTPATSKPLPTMIKISGIEEPFIGNVQFDGKRAKVAVTSFGALTLNGPGFAVDSQSKMIGLPIKCHRSQLISKQMLCTDAELLAKTRFDVVFPKGLDILKR